MSNDSIEFMECEECSAKPGTPALCKSCLHNRGVISNLINSNRNLVVDLAEFAPDLVAQLLERHRAINAPLKDFLKALSDRA